MKSILTLAVLLLASCGPSGPADNKARQLENAANVSTPAAAEVLRNGADRVREGEDEHAEAETQRVVNEAANAASREP